MRFSFEESELINNFFEGKEEISQDAVIKELEETLSNTEEKELLDIINSTIYKIKSLNVDDFKKIISDIPIDTYTIY